MMYNIQKSEGVIYMKKVLFLLIILFGVFNSFSAHIVYRQGNDEPCIRKL